MREMRALFAEAWAIRPEYYQMMVECLKTPSAILFDPVEFDTPRADMSGATAIIPVKGPLMSGSTGLMQMLFGGTGYSTIVDQINAAADDDTVASIVLDIDSPGGAISGIADVVDAIHSAGKPVVAYTGGTMASAAYWIASAANQIVVSPQAVVGSIGAVMMLRDYSKLDEKMGIEDIEIVSSQSPHKRPDPKTDSGKATLQAHIDELAQVFIDAVADNRGTTSEDVAENYGKGGVFVGNSAKVAGMVDSIGVFNDVAKGGVMPTAKIAQVDRAYLDENCPELVASLLSEGAANIETTTAQAVAAERERVKAIMALATDSETVEIAVQAVTAGLDAEVAKAMVGASVSAAKKMAEKRKPVTPLGAEMAAVENPDVGAGDVGLSEEDAFIQAVIEAGRSAGVKFHKGAA